MQILSWLGALLILGLLVVAVVVMGQRRMVFPGTALAPARGASEVPNDVAQTWLSTPSGSVEAWYLPASTGTSTTAIIFAHGNYELIDHWLEPMRAVVAMGASVLLVEFPGYGHSAGAPGRSSLKDAFSAAYDWLVAQPGVDPDRVVAMGRSLGGGAAVDLDSQRELGGLILLSTFSSAARMAWEAFRLPGVVVRDRFDNGSTIRTSQTPTLILHGERDNVIPFSHARTLASQREGIALIPLECGHNDCMRLWPTILEGIRRFLVDEGLL